MCVATATHRAEGPFTSKGGCELPLSNLAAAALLTKMLTAKPPAPALVAAEPSEAKPA